MKTTVAFFHRLLAILVLNLIGVHISCNAQSTSATGAIQQLAPLKIGDTAYLRVKSYTPPAGEPSVQTADGAVGYVLKNLNPNAIGVINEPRKDSVTLTFGAPLVLIESKESKPVLWHVKKDSIDVWLPSYLLTASKEEIAFLKEHDRIPESMTWIYEENKEWKQWGNIIGGIGGSFIIESHGLPIMAYELGTSPAAIKGNAVMFDEAMTKAAWKKPIVFNADKAEFTLSVTSLYYCNSGGDVPSFECLDLASLKSSK